VNKKSEITEYIQGLYSTKRKREIESEIMRGGKIAEKHGETKTAEKSSKQFQICLAPRRGREN
jgi:hypothetical protein